MARFLNAAVVGMFVASFARLASAQDGPGTNPVAPPTASSVSSAAPPAAVPLTEAMRLDEYLNRLDAWRNEGRITAAQAARARRLLNAAVVSGDRSVRVPLDASGRIDLLVLARGTADSATASAKPGERVVERVLNEFDIRMRVNARDLAAPANLSLFDNAPGYAAVPARDLGRIAQDALETTPMRELPGGARLVSAIDALPNTAGVKADHTFKELSHLVGDGQENWLRARVGSFVEDHKIETGVLAFAAITGLRMASPGAARFMDGLGIRLRILRKSTPDARLYTTGRLVYRNGYVLPEFEIESGARHVAGSTTFRVTTAAVLGAEALHHARGRVGMGARWERGRVFADSNATYAFPEHLARTELRGGYLTETGFVVSGAVAATFGYGSGAIGVAPGRFGFELDLTKMLVFGRTGGETGLFFGTGSDSDFSHSDWRGGLVFRLRF